MSSGSISDRGAFIAALLKRYDDIVLPLVGEVAAEAKDDGSAVTRADRDVSDAVLEALMAHTPAYGAVLEEERKPYLPQADWQWVVDPLDGTAAFARGLPVWGLGMALLHRNELREGYLHFPLVGETYAFRDGVGTRNGKRIELPKNPVEADCLNVMITEIHSFVDIRRIECMRFHNMGSNLYHLMALATGRCEAIITGPCQIWDLAPALPFTRQIGCVERYLDGSPFIAAELMRREKFDFPISQPMIVGRPEEVERLLDAVGTA